MLLLFFMKGKNKIKTAQRLDLNIYKSQVNSFWDPGVPAWSSCLILSLPLEMMQLFAMDVLCQSAIFE